MEVKQIYLKDLKPLEANVRNHNKTQIDEMVRSVQQFGQTRAMVVDENMSIMIGNGLYQALVQLGWETADCYVISGLTKTQKKKLILSDNKVFQLGSDNYAVLQDYLNDITGVGDFDIAGFSPDVLKGLSQSFTESVNEMNNYGVITDERLKEQPEQPAAAAAPAQTASAAPVSAPAPAVEYNMPPAEKTMKSVVCPSCGEVIYIE